MDAEGKSMDLRAKDPITVDPERTQHTLHVAPLDVAPLDQEVWVAGLSVSVLFYISF